MFLKKVLNQPNLVGTMLIALMVCGGFVYTFAFDGFNVQTATGGEVEAWLEAASGGGSGGNQCGCGYEFCPTSSCSGCHSIDAFCEEACGTCSCTDFCSNFKSFKCQKDNKTNTCLRNP